MGEWVSIADRLPEQGKDVLIFIRHGPKRCFIRIAYMVSWGDSYLWLASGNKQWFPDNVTHWMPLPEWPKAC